MRISQYRPDIDGLRAVAVLAVVLFHAFPHALPGGFVGVDIFFVISGYLISRVLYDELDAGNYGIRRFYVRRIKRIFPALCVTLVAVLAAGWFALLAAEYVQLGRHVAASAGFVANVVLYGESGYFDAAAELKPLLHLWSLGIEEQFYVVWPVLLALLWRWRRAVPYTMAALMLASATVGVLLTDRDAAGAFFLPHARFWELLAGALLSYAERQRRLAGQALPARLADVAGVAGLGLLATSLVLIDETVPFPGYWALLPVAGSALVLAAGPGALVNRTLLTARPTVFVGLISYPLYLWHWPLLSLARICETGEPAAWIRVVAVGLAIALSWSTYRFVETPIRFPAVAGGRRSRWAVPGLILALVAVAALGMTVVRLKGVPARVADLDASNAPFRWVNVKHTPGCAERFPFLEDGHCKLSRKDKPPTVVLVGDSHADALNLGLAEYLNAKGEVLLQMGADTGARRSSESSDTSTASPRAACRTWRPRCASSFSSRRSTPS